MTQRAFRIELVSVSECDTSDLSIRLWSLARADAHAGQAQRLQQPFNGRRYTAYSHILHAQAEHREQQAHHYAILSKIGAIGLAEIRPQAELHALGAPLPLGMAKWLAALGIYHTLVEDRRIAYQVNAWVGHSIDGNSGQALADAYSQLHDRTTELRGELTEHRPWAIVPRNIVRPNRIQQQALEEAGIRPVATGWFATGESGKAFPYFGDLYVGEAGSFGQLARVATAELVLPDGQAASSLEI